MLELMGRRITAKMMYHCVASISFRLWSALAKIKGVQVEKSVKIMKAILFCIDLIFSSHCGSWFDPD